MDYFVPNFGVDEDIKDSMASLAESEAQLSHEWKFGLPETKMKYHNVAKDTLYNFDMKLDEDMINTQAHANAAADLVGGGDESSLIQIGSDPIFSSLGKPKSKWTAKEQAKIVQYPDPEVQGLDEDIKTTQKNEIDSAMRLGEPSQFA